MSDDRPVEDLAVDHAGIATDDLDGLVSLYGDLFGCPVAHEERLDGMHVTFLAFENGYFELLGPTGDDGTITRYLADNGPGIHHIAVATPDIERALDRARAAGVELIDEEPRRGAWGHDVAFLHPEDTGGILLEFVEG